MHRAEAVAAHRLITEPPSWRLPLPSSTHVTRDHGGGRRGAPVMIH
jgi:hypothetical protein